MIAVGMQQLELVVENANKPNEIDIDKQVGGGVCSAPRGDGNFKVSARSHEKLCSLIIYHSLHTSRAIAPQWPASNALTHTHINSYTCTYRGKFPQIGIWR